MNQPFEKLYGTIKLLSRSLCKIRSKYLDLKELVGTLEPKTKYSCPIDDLKKLEVENLVLREQVKTQKNSLLAKTI